MALSQPITNQFSFFFPTPRTDGKSPGNEPPRAQDNSKTSRKAPQREADHKKRYHDAQWRADKVLRREITATRDGERRPLLSFLSFACLFFPPSFLAATSWTMDGNTRRTTSTTARPDGRTRRTPKKMARQTVGQRSDAHSQRSGDRKPQWTARRDGWATAGRSRGLQDATVGRRLDAQKNCKTRRHGQNKGTATRSNRKGKVPTPSNHRMKVPPDNVQGRSTVR